MAKSGTSANTEKKASRKPKRDAYDEFLEQTGEKTAAKGTKKKAAASNKKATGDGASKKRASGAKNAKGSSAASQKKRAVEPGIGMTQASSGGAARSGKKTSASRGKSAGVAPGISRTGGAGRPSARGGSASRSRSSTVVPIHKARGNAVLYVDNGGRDAYDDYLDKGAPVRKKKRKKKSSAGAVSACILLLMCIAGLAALGVWQHGKYQDFLMMKAVVERQSFYEGTTVDGVDVSSMTLEQALQHWHDNIEPGYSGRTVTLSNGASFTAGELGYTSDYITVLNNAWSAGRSGSLEQRYAAISSRQQRPVSYTVTRVPYSEELVQACVAAIAEQIDAPASDAKIESFDVSTCEFTFTEEKTGSKLDAARLYQDMLAALDNGGGTAELVVKAIQPDVTKQEIASQYGMIASAVTNASSSSSNRLTNIKLSLELISGTALEPGETFSFNDTVGQRTTKRGFKVATAYSSGEVTEDVGGGICQVSTTLFNAAVKADMEIVERHNHSLTVGYVDKGKDAAVNWNSQDLRFTNNSGDRVYIVCYLSGDKRVYVGIFGKLLPNGEYITVEGETTGTIDFETTYQVNMNMFSGTTNVVQQGKVGYEAVAYKIRWDANGNRISKELLCRSRYKATNQIVEYGP